MYECYDGLPQYLISIRYTYDIADERCERLYSCSHEPKSQKQLKRNEWNMNVSGIHNWSMYYWILIGA